MSDRLYKVTYIDPEDSEEYEAVFPESILNTIEEMVAIELVGNLADGYTVVVDEEPDDNDKEPIPLKRSGTKS